MQAEYMFDPDWGGYFECPHIDDQPSALVGFTYSEKQTELYPTLAGLKEAHCCLMPAGVAILPHDDDCFDRQFCKNRMGEQ